MENNEKKKYTKVLIAGFVLIAVFVAAYIVTAILDVFIIIPNFLWVVYLCVCISWLIIGCINWAKIRWLSIANFILSAAYAYMGIMELLRLLS